MHNNAYYILIKNLIKLLIGINNVYQFYQNLKLYSKE